MKNFCVKFLSLVMFGITILPATKVKSAHIVAPAIAAQNAKRAREEQEKQELLDKFEELNESDRKALLEELEEKTNPQKENTLEDSIKDLPISNIIILIILIGLFIFAVGILPMLMF